MTESEIRALAMKTLAAAYNHYYPPLKHGSPLRRFLRAEKAAANTRAYHSTCRAWEALPGCGITWRTWNRIAKAGGMIRRYVDPRGLMGSKPDDWSNRPAPAPSVDGIRSVLDMLKAKSSE